MSDELLMAVQIPRLRPGCHVLEPADDKLHLAFANHTVTFTTPVVTRIVRAFAKRMNDSLHVADLLAAVAGETGADDTVIRYVFEMLSASHCLYWSDAETSSHNGDDPLWRYYASIGEDPAAVTKRLTSVRPFVVTSDSGYAPLQDALTSAGINADLLPLPVGAATSEIALAKSRHDDGGGEVMACWNFAYRSDVARLVNETAMSGQPVLFGGCEGLLGRIGPYVVSKATACLECLNRRLLANGGAEEMSCFSAYRQSLDGTVVDSVPAHPAFVRAMAALFVLELSQIILNRPPQTLGAVVEYSAAGDSPVRRPLLKAPRCAACSNSRPPRFGWNVAFASPRVKDGASEL